MISKNMMDAIAKLEADHARELEELAEGHAQAMKELKVGAT